MKWAYLICLFISCLMLSCGTDCDSCDPIFTSNQVEFANLGEKHEQLFRVDSLIVIGQPGDTVLRSSFLKEIIHQDDPTTQATNYIVERWISEDGQNFTPSNAESYEVINTDVIRQVGNIPFKIMELPYRSMKSWNGAKFFDPADFIITVEGEPINFFAGDWYETFTFSAFEISEEIEGISYDSVITVNWADHTALTEIRAITEKYAWNKGLIYREMFVFDEFCDQASDLCREELRWTVRGDRGFYVKQWRIN